jgi:hypothetical protein
MTPASALNAMAERTILAALGKEDIVRLDDTAAREVRGTAYPLYVLVKILGINTLD